ncbi:transcription-repair coupling factor [Vibrio ishigakensis]|uniref:Transcription-repair coupling factor n=1 Tax=Vibrio ishigakensis TaxID=1481914 RepID=A0A0B8P7E5_9VIBR|nr:transcription-repair coupling factor [Vibrio ishigakensis]
MQVSKETWPAGIEYWQPLFFEQTETLFDYMPENTLMLTVGDIEASVDTFLTDVDYRFDQRRVDPLSLYSSQRSCGRPKSSCLPHLRNGLR